MLDGDVEKAAAAYHEAGHAVVAIKNGETLQSLSIGPDSQSPGAWIGNASLERQPPSLSFALIALCGPLAEAKYRAEQHFGLSINLDGESVPSEVIDTIEDEDSNKLARFRIDFVGQAGQLFRFDVCCNVFSFDLDFIREKRFARSELEKTYADACIILNAAETWRIIKRVSEELRLRPIVDGFCTMTADEVIRLCRSRD